MDRLCDDQTANSVLRKLFLGHQDQLRAALGADRGTIDHGPLKGAASEDHWRDLLDLHLPRRYRVATGVVVDSNGDQSEQIDIIIHDAQYCPRFRDKGGLSFVPAESVYAVLEVKQEVNAQHLGEAADKAASVRRLERTTTTIVDRGEKRPARDLPYILAGIVALTCGWKDGLAESFRSRFVRCTGDRALDLGCALHGGAFEVPEGEGPHSIAITGEEMALVAFFMSLVRRLQKLGTVPAIEWPTYERAFRD